RERASWLSRPHGCGAAATDLRPAHVPVASAAGLKAADPPAAAGGSARKSAVVRNWLRDVTVDQLRHLEHRNRTLAVEDRLELLVRIDLRADLRVLELVLLDVIPDLLRDLGPGHWFGADNGGELFIRGNRFHESGVWFPSRFLWHTT